MLPHDRPDADAERPGRRRRPRARRPGRRAHAGQRLRLRRRGDRLRRRHDPHRPRRRRRRRRHRGGRSTRCRIAAFAAMQALSTRNDDPERGVAPLRHGPRRLRARRGRRRRRARDRRARQGPRRARSTPSSPAWACPPTRTTSPRPSRRAPAPPAPCSRRSSGPVLGADGHRPHQRARDLDPGRRHRRGQRDPACVRRRASTASPCRATKSMTGHLLGGAGALESVVTILALHDRLAPPTINLDDPDPDVHARRRPRRAAHAARRATSRRSTTRSASAATTSR